MIQDVVIVGARGNVGKTLVSQILKRGDTDANIHSNPTRIIGLVALSEYALNPKGLSEKECLDFIGKPESAAGVPPLEKVFETIKKTRFPAGESVVFVDVTASKGMLGFHLKVINDTKFGVVTANKNPVTLCSFEEFKALTDNPFRYGYRCSVMAGAEAISFLQDLCDVNDRPTQIRGCFSGTLGYICYELERGRSLSSIIREARDKGYTEPHPRDDLSGLDVARKLLILVRTAGYEANLDEVAVEPFISKKYLACESVEDFLESTKELDKEFSEKVQGAAKRGNVLRYVAEMSMKNGKASLKTSLQEAPKESPLGALKGTSNKIVVVSGAYPEQTPYAVEAPGAGLQVTAQNVRRDLLYRLSDRRSTI